MHSIVDIVDYTKLLEKIKITWKRRKDSEKEKVV